MSSDLPWPVDAEELDTREPGATTDERALPLPDDGPRYHEEDASAALLNSAYQPLDDWNPLQCPECDLQWLTDDARCQHFVDEHGDGRWVAEDTEPSDAIEMVNFWVSTNANNTPTVAHLDDGDGNRGCRYANSASAGRWIEHRGEIPLSIDSICAFCLRRHHD